jgi:S1-C subfamily serine protease
MSTRSKIALAFLAGITVASLGVLVFSVVKGNLTEKFDSLVLKDVDQETVDQITGKLVYAADTTGVVDYYSPTIDVTFKYDRNVYNVFEITSAVSINKKNSYGSNALFATIRTDVETDPVEYFSNYFKNHGSDLKVGPVKEESDGLKTIVISYKEPVTLGTEESTKYVSIIYKETTSGYLVLVGKNVNADDTSDMHYSDLKDMMVSASTDTSGVDTNISAELKDGALEVGFDKKDWTVIYHGQDTISLEYVSNNPGEGKARVFVLDLYESMDISKEGLLADLSEEIGYIGSYDGYSNFAITEKALEEEFSGVKFYGVAYTYNYSYDPDVVYYVEKYSGVDSDRGLSLSLELQYTTNTMAARGSAYQVLDGITFKEPGTVLGSNSESTVEIKKAIMLGKPGVGHIFSRPCVTVSFDDNPALAYSGGKSYEVCSAGFGSGFWVNKDGYMITNAHVAAQNSTDVFVRESYMSAVYNNNYNLGWAMDFVKDLYVLYASQGLDISTLDDEGLISLALQVALSLEDSGIVSIADSAASEVYIQKGKPFDIDAKSYKLLNSFEHIKATLVDANRMTSAIKAEITGSKMELPPDLALLKAPAPLGGEEYPALRLASFEGVSAGNSVYVIGFPGIADNKMLFSNTAEVIPTVTAGTVSAVKPSSSNAYKLVQVDASVEHGNSGGPILSLGGEVIGVATYGLGADTAADINAGVSSEEVRRVLERNGIENDIGGINGEINEGILNINRSYYKRAVTNLENAVALNQGVESTVRPLIKVSQDKIDQGLDKTPWVSLGNFDIPNTGLIAGGVSLVGVFGLVVLIIVLKSRSKGKADGGKGASQVPPAAGQTTQPGVVQVPQAAQTQPMQAQPVPQAPVPPAQTVPPAPGVPPAVSANVSGQQS